MAVRQDYIRRRKRQGQPRVLAPRIHFDNPIVGQFIYVEPAPQIVRKKIQVPPHWYRLGPEPTPEILPAPPLLVAPLIRRRKDSGVRIQWFPSGLEQPEPVARLLIVPGRQRPRISGLHRLWGPRSEEIVPPRLQPILRAPLIRRFKDSGLRIQWFSMNPTEPVIVGAGERYPIEWYRRRGRKA